MTGHAPGQARGGAHRYMDVPCIALSGAIRGTSLDPSYVPCNFYIDIYSTWDTATFLAVLLKLSQGTCSTGLVLPRVRMYRVSPSRGRFAVHHGTPAMYHATFISIFAALGILQHFLQYF